MKLILYIWEKLWTIRRALYYTTLMLLSKYFILNTYFNLTVFLFEDRQLYSYI